MDDSTRLMQSSFAELIDRLSIDQIKEIFCPENRDSYSQEMENIQYDIDLILKKSGKNLSARLILLTIALAQINLHIWFAKDIMQKEPELFQEKMKLAHQLNGIRNQIKNRLLVEVGHIAAADFKTNTNIEDLDGWIVSVLHPRGVKND